MDAEQELLLVGLVERSEMTKDASYEPFVLLGARGCESKSEQKCLDEKQESKDRAILS